MHSIQFLLWFLKLLMELWVVVKSQDLASRCERCDNTSPSSEEVPLCGFMMV